MIGLCGHALPCLVHLLKKAVQIRVLAWDDYTGFSISFVDCHCLTPE